eukprot:292812_1
MADRVIAKETTCCHCFSRKTGIILISIVEMIVGLVLIIGMIFWRRDIDTTKKDLTFYIIMCHACFYPGLLSLISCMFGIVVACNKHKDIKLDLGLFIPYVIITGAWCLVGLMICVTAFIECEFRGLIVKMGHLQTIQIRIGAVIIILGVAFRIYFTKNIYKFINETNINGSIFEHRKKSILPQIKSDKSIIETSENNLIKLESGDNITVSQQHVLMDGNVTIKPVKNRKSVMMTKGNEPIAHLAKKSLSDELFNEGINNDDTTATRTTTIGDTLFDST